MGRHPDQGGTKQQAHVDEQLGLTVTDLTPEIARHLGYPYNVEGVIITVVDPDGIAYEKELHEDMLILCVDKKRVRTVREYKVAMNGLSLEKGILLLTKTRGGATTS